MTAIHLSRSFEIFEFFVSAFPRVILPGICIICIIYINMCYIINIILYNLLLLSLTFSLCMSLILCKFLAQGLCFLVQSRSTVEFHIFLGLSVTLY